MFLLLVHRNFSMYVHNSVARYLLRDLVQLAADKVLLGLLLGLIRAVGYNSTVLRQLPTY